MSPFWDRKSDEEKAAEDQAGAEQAATVAALEKGDIPPKARQRLSELRLGGETFFTSDLSVPGFILAHEQQLTPLSQVMGSCTYHIGYQYRNSSYYGFISEQRVLTEAYNEARRRALLRLWHEASAVGADVVCGLELNIGRHGFTEDAIEWTAVGTAMRDPRHPAGELGPALTDLTAQDYWKLTEAGYRPAGVVGASAVFMVSPSWRTQNAMGGGRWFGGQWNQELSDFTQGFYAARETAISRLQQQAQSLHANGIVGVQITQRHREFEINERTCLQVTFHIIGTGIREAPLDHERQAIFPVMRLNTKGRR